GGRPPDPRGRPPPALVARAHRLRRPDAGRLVRLPPRRPPRPPTPARPLRDARRRRAAAPRALRRPPRRPRARPRSARLLRHLLLRPAHDRRRRRAGRRRAARLRLRPPGRRPAPPAAGPRPSPGARRHESRPTLEPRPERSPRVTLTHEDIMRPYGRDLTAPELEAVACQFAARPELWSEHVSHDPDHRTYAQL